MEDWQLLQEYHRTGSEAAFGRLVERHLGLVHGVARRQVGDDALAADVAQAVFLLLARKAGTVGSRVVVSGWLFRTTRFVASRALRAEGRRRRREMEAVAMHALHSGPDHREDPSNPIAPELDEALERLGATDRDLLLLRFAEGRNHREVGQALGISEEAAKKRANRALERLRRLLAAPGVAVTSAALTALLADRLTAAPPSGLADRILRVAAGRNPAGGAALELARRGPSAWRWLGLPAVATGVVALLLVGLVALRVMDPRAPGSSGVAPTDPLAAGPASAPAASHRSGGVPAVGEGIFRLRVVSAETGDPLAGVRVPINLVVDEEWIRPADLFTDPAGVCDIPLPASGLRRIDAGAHAEGHEDRFFTWRSHWPFPLPSEHTLRLSRAATAGGWTVDPEGRPVAGVEVWVSYFISDTSWREPDEDIERPGFLFRLPVGVTGSDGRWHCATLPPSAPRYGFEFEHPDFVKHDHMAVGRDEDRPEEVRLREDLAAGRVKVVLQPGGIASGRVVDLAGQPVAGARIAPDWTGDGVRTGDDGRFVLRRLPAGDVMMTATADGHSPETFTVVAGADDMEVRLAPGGVVRVRVVDSAGLPVAGARLTLNGGFGPGSIGWSGTTDAEGRVVWRGAPRDGRVEFWVGAPGYITYRSVGVDVGGAEKEVVLLPALEVVGTVVDAETGDLVRDRFKVIPGNGAPAASYDHSAMRYGTNGHFALVFEDFNRPVVRIEAVGYLPEVGEPLPGPGGSLRCDMRLRRTDPSQAVHGIVLNPDGTPAAGAEVALCTLDYGAALGRGRLLDLTGAPIVRTDAGGRFAFGLVRAPHTVVAISPAGSGRARAVAGGPLAVRLEAFGTIEGRAVRGGRPFAGGDVILSDNAYLDYPGAVVLDVRSFTARTDRDGRFVLHDVPVGDYQAYLSDGIGLPLTDPTPAEAVPGNVVSVVVGEPDPAGFTVVGRWVASEPVEIGDWRRVLTARHLARRLPEPVPPAGLSGEALALWLVDWHQSDAGRARRRLRWTAIPEVETDGTFRIPGVVPGEYELSVRIQEGGATGNGLRPPPEGRWTGHGQRTATLAGEAAATVDLGAIPVSIRHAGDR